MIICFDLLKILAKEMIRSKRGDERLDLMTESQLLYAILVLGDRAVLKGSEAS